MGEQRNGPMSMTRLSEIFSRGNTVTLQVVSKQVTFHKAGITPTTWSHSRYKVQTDLGKVTDKDTDTDHFIDERSWLCRIELVLNFVDHCNHIHHQLQPPHYRP